MDFNQIKEEIKHKLREKNCLTRTQILKCVDDNEELVEHIYKVLTETDKVAIRSDDGSLQCILDPAPQIEQRSPHENHFIFISYGHECKGIKLAYRLCKDLENRVGYTVWLDVRNITPGDPWEDNIEEGIKDAKVVLAVLTPHAIRKKSVCRDEIHFALLHEVNIIPIKGDSDPKVTQLRLARRHYLDFSNNENYEVNFQKLLGALSGDRTRLLRPIPVIAKEEPFDFGHEIALYSNHFTGREWIKKEIDTWLSDPFGKKVFLITGDIGSGKSAIAAWLSQIYPDQAIGIHFCMRNSEKNFPGKFVINIAAQLSEKLNGYKEILEQRDLYDVGINASDTFRRLIVDPLSSNDLSVPDKTVFIIVDALDESKQKKEDSETIFRIIDGQSKFLPSWLRIVATTRPKRFIKDVMRGYSRILDMNKKRSYHDQDIRDYLEEQFSGVVLKSIIDNSGLEKEEYVEEIVRKSKGNFLYAVLAVNFFSEDDPLHMPGELPPTISGFFLKGFEELFPLDEDFDKIRPILEVICFAREHLSAEEIAFFCGKSTYEVKKLLLKIEDFIPFDETQKYRPFHISFLEWLKGDLGECDEYAIDLDEGRRIMANGCFKEFRKGILSMRPYTLNYIALHLLEAGQEERLAEVLADPSYFVTMWKKDEFIFKANWVQIERNSNVRISTVYRPVLINPGSVKNDEFIFWLSEFFDDVERRKEAISLFEYLIYRYIETDQKEKLQNVLSSVAFSLYLIRNDDIALKILQISEYIARILDDLHGLQKSYFYHATIDGHHDVETGLILFRLQQKLCEGLTDPWSRAYWQQLSYGNEGCLLNDLGQFKQAMDLYRLKEEKSREMGIQQGIQWAYNWQASELLRQGKNSEALKLFKKQEKIADEIGYKRGLKRSLIMQKYIFLKQGNFKHLKNIEEKLQNLEEPDEDTIPDFNFQRLLDHLKTIYSSRVEKNKEKHEKVSLIQNIGILAVVHEIDGNFQKSLEYLQEQEALCRESDNAKKIIPLLNTIRVLDLSGDIDREFDTCCQALKQERSYSDTVELYLRLMSIIKNLNRLGKYQLSFMFLKETWKLYPKIKDVFNEFTEANYLNLIAQKMYSNGNYFDSIIAGEALEKLVSVEKNIPMLTNALAYQALSHEASGEFEQALSLYTRQADISDVYKDLIDRAWPIKNQGDVLRKLGNLEDARNKYLEQKDLAEKSLSHQWSLDALEGLGSINDDWCDFEHALLYYQELEDLSKDNDIVAHSFALERQGRVWLRKGDLGRAIERFNNMENILGSTNESDILTRSIRYQAGILQERGEISSSIKILQKLIPLLPGITAEKWHARCMKSQDIVHHLAKEYDYEYLLFLDDRDFVNKSVGSHEWKNEIGYRSLFKERNSILETIVQKLLDHFTLLEEICERTGFKMGFQYSVGTKGILYLIQGMVTDASVSFSKMEDICSNIGYRFGLQLSYGRQADVAFALNQYEKALDFSIRQEQICRDMNLIEDLCVSYGKQALIQYHLGNYREAFDLFKRQEEIALKASLLYWQQKSMEGQGIVHLILGNMQDSLNAFLAQEEICRSIGDPRLIWLSIFHTKQVYEQLGDIVRTEETITKMNETLCLFK